MPLKIHIIISHYLEFFNEKNESMLSYNDEFTESMHSAIRLFEQHHKYFNSKKNINLANEVALSFLASRLSSWRSDSLPGEGE